MNQANGVATCKMINNYLKKYPALRAIVLIIKAFLHQRSMNEVYSGGLGSYSIVCLAVSFLQVSRRRPLCLSYPPVFLALEDLKATFVGSVSAYIHFF